MVPYPAPIERAQIYRVLESAVVLSWKELHQSSHKGVIHVEYGTAPEPSLQYLKIWLARRQGTWDLICEYWMCPGTSTVPAAGLTFSNGYYSAHLAQMLEDVMRHHDGIPGSLSGDTALGLIAVESPTEDKRQKAGNCMSQAYQRMGLEFAKYAGSAA